jgi:hypothetical protein
MLSPARPKVAQLRPPARSCAAPHVGCPWARLGLVG